jgi:hypothetical protein
MQVKVAVWTAAIQIKVRKIPLKYQSENLCSGLEEKRKVSSPKINKQKNKIKII